MKKTIAFVIPNLNAGGAERVVSTLANLLIKEFHVYIILLYKGDSFYKLDSDIQVTYCQLEYNPNPSLFQSISNNFRLVKNIAKHLKRNNIDLAIGFLPATNVYTIIASKISKIPCIISERANPELNRINKVWQTLRKLAYPFSSCLIVQTEGTKNYFKNYKLPEINIIKNPINTELLENRNLLIPKENIILNIGRLVDLKNQELLIRAFSNIENKNWKLIFVGDGYKLENYKQLVSSLGLQKQILFTGKIKDVSEYFNKSKIFAFTSNHEGFPNVLIEAMSFGLACVSTNCPFGPSEIIENHKNGLLIPVNDQKALENCLTELMTKPELRNSFGQNALESINNYNPSIIIKEWTMLINKFIDS